MRLLMIFLYLLLVLLGLSFAVLNAGTVDINLYLIRFSLPVSVLMLLVLALGMLLGFSLMACRYWSLKIKQRSLERKLKSLQSEANPLPAVPFKAQH